MQIRMPWHFPECRRVRLVKRYNVLAACVQWPRSSDTRVEAEHPAMSRHLFITSVPMSRAWIADHATVLSVMSMMVVMARQFSSWR